ncbi:MAG: redoxin family protein [Betaproteobacteria bacterium]|nr:redoxin family protein [Betaproteobacteria bacterium]
MALVFFATWCAPCREGIRQLAARAADLRAARVSVVLVNYQEDAPRVRGFLDGPPAFPLAIDRFGDSEPWYLRTGDDQVRRPRTVVIGRDIVVRTIHRAEGRDFVGRILEDGDRVRRRPLRAFARVLGLADALALAAGCGAAPMRHQSRAAVQRSPGVSLPGPKTSTSSP